MEKHEENTKVYLKEIREKFYELRSFEISNLWQRSIFLSALLVLFFSGYGYLVSKLLEETNFSSNKVLIINEICCGVALLAIVFSIIWIMMAKGSKAWFEVYERRILKIEEEKELGISDDYKMESKCSPWSLDSNLLTNNAGAYSVSKLNIIIGRFLMIMWLIIFLIHYIASFILIINNDDEINYITNGVVLTLLLIFLLYIIITARNNRWAKSGSLTPP
ncbi:RipA family octameric membrane protein [Capnocytophaga cynodegmi]|uniref:RipA family octameric membrane protein n=1 Tax=Capnocytophaga cynodegmi TaxID=28189 RepID=UPI001AC72AE1|nr:hypothetical protein [Capnocytophaga cynodegmi]GIM53446.1 hypothetical protein CAPN005_00930 [Capnocytophaga cynodegmi]